MRSSWAWCLIAMLCAPSFAFAQGKEEESPWQEEGASEPTEQVKEAAPDEAAEGEKGASTESEAPKAEPSWWFGAYFQGNFVPSFMLKIFLDAAPTVAGPAFGVTATHRSADGMSITVGLGYASYGFGGPFRISGDPETDTEYLDSTLGMLHLRGQMTWSTPIVSNMLSFEYGVGLDLGVVLGSLTRTEAYKDTSGNFQRCTGPLVPNPVFCEPPTGFPVSRSDAYDQHGAHYGVVEKRVPPVAGALMLPVLALRYTPIRELALQLYGSFGLLQFSLGLSAAYGI